jgi:AraC-like DNA-binding protein
MFVARGRTQYRAAELCSTVAFGAGMTLVYIERRGLIWDTRFIPAADGPSPDACLFLLLEGRWATTGAPEERAFSGPAAFAIASAQLEGADGERPYTFVADGEPFRALDLRLPASGLRVALASSPTPIPLSDERRRACEAVARAAPDDAAFEREAASLLRALASDGLLDSPLAERFAEPSPIFGRFWDAIRPMIERHYLSPTLQEVSADSGISLRQLDRIIQSFVDASPLLRGHSWRGATKRLRLKAAVLLLSAEGATIGEVSRLVGYGSGEAMARAFRDAGLPSPSAVQAIRKNTAVGRRDARGSPPK